MLILLIVVLTIAAVAATADAPSANLAQMQFRFFVANTAPEVDDLLAVNVGAPLAISMSTPVTAL
jgi:uncharacterized membrane protein YciS (DUF1049 family)